MYMILVDSVINDTEDALFFIQTLKTNISQDKVFYSNQSGNQLIFNLKLFIESKIMSEFSNRLVQMLCITLFQNFL